PVLDVAHKHGLIGERLPGGWHPVGYRLDGLADLLERELRSGLFTADVLIIGHNTELPCGDAHPVVVGGRGVVQEERLLDELHRVRRSGADAHNVTHELRTLRRIVPEAGYALRENVYP